MYTNCFELILHPLVGLVSLLTHSTLQFTYPRLIPALQGGQLLLPLLPVTIKTKWVNDMPYSTVEIIPSMICPTTPLKSYPHILLCLEENLPVVGQHPTVGIWVHHTLLSYLVYHAENHTYFHTIAYSRS